MIGRRPRSPFFPATPLFRSGIRQYSGHVWELHPLVVSPAHRRPGIGRALVTDLEARVSERGGLTLWLGTDDEHDQTTLSGVDRKSTRLNSSHANISYAVFCL